MTTTPAAAPNRTSIERFAILAHGKLDIHDAKVALAMLRYRQESVVAIVDRNHAGQDAQSIVGTGGSVPVVASLDEAIALGANCLLIGTAPPGGGLPAEWRPELLAGLASGLDLYSGLHTFLNDDLELVASAQRAGAALVDLRAVPEDLSTPCGARERVKAPVVLTVGSDCNVGKMTVSWELMKQAHDKGIDARFVATGQTGVLLAGRGMAIDRVISDFVAGATERLIEEAYLDGEEAGELILVEGQGSLIHPFYSAVTLGLVHGSRPDSMILCHNSSRTEVRHCPGRKIPPMVDLVQIYEQAVAWIDPAKVVGVALATYSLNEEQALQEIERVKAATGLPVEDVVRFETGELLAACLAGSAGVV